MHVINDLLCLYLRLKVLETLLGNIMLSNIRTVNIW